MTAFVMAVVMVSIFLLGRTICLHRKVIVDTAVKDDLQRISRGKNSQRSISGQRAVAPHRNFTQPSHQPSSVRKQLN